MMTKNKTTCVRVRSCSPYRTVIVLSPVLSLIGMGRGGVEGGATYTELGILAVCYYDIKY